MDYTFGIFKWKLFNNAVINDITFVKNFIRVFILFDFSNVKLCLSKKLYLYFNCLYILSQK